MYLVTAIAMSRRKIKKLEQTGRWLADDVLQHEWNFVERFFLWDCNLNREDAWPTQLMATGDVSSVDGWTYLKSLD